MNNLSNIVCPHCDAVNRVPRERLAEGPVCGKCKHLLFTAQPLELGGHNFMRHVTRNDIPVLVDFWAPWCGPCRMMAPAYEKAAQRLEPGVRVAKLNTEEAQQIAAQFNIQSIPTLVLFMNGQEVDRKLGAQNAALIESWIKART